MANHQSNASTVHSGRIFLFATIPATLWLANFRCPCGTKSGRRFVADLRARASFYFYNTKAEVDRFVEVVKEIQKFFGQ